MDEQDEPRFKVAKLNPHAKKKWERPSRSFLAAIGISVLLVVGAYFLVPRQTPVAIPDTPGLYQSGLSLEELRFDPVVGEDRVIEGSIRNTTDKPQKQVQVLFRLGALSKMDVGEVEVIVPLIPPGEKATFRTKPIPQGADRWTVAALRAVE